MIVNPSELDFGSMAVSLKQIDILKQVDDLTKATVYGYVREAKESCNLDQRVPSEITQIVLLFYYLAEHFEIHSDEIDVLGDHKDTIQKNPDVGWHNLTFGAVSVPSMSDNIFIWTFEMLKNDAGGNGFGLGIINSKDAKIESTSIDATSSKLISSYMYATPTSICKNGITSEGDYGECLGYTGTIIKMKLDMTKGELSYFKNGKDLGVAFEVDKGEDIEYKIAVVLYWRYAKFKLVSFECVH